MKRLEQTFTSYKNDQRLTEKARTMLTYLAHLFCEARSILDGYVCRDNYNTPGPLTAHKDTYTLTELRRVLLEEHNIRRILRNLGSLRESTILNTIAQNYANDLCEA